jgi:hypothetical protein
MLLVESLKIMLAEEKLKTDLELEKKFTLIETHNL